MSAVCEPSGDRLLILSCSQRKNPDSELLPAVERYDGPTFRVLRRFLREKPSETVDVRVLSAEFGLISQDLPVPNYDRRMTPARARQLRSQVVTEFNCIINAQRHHTVFVLVGRDYLIALGSENGLFLPGTSVKVGAGTMGKRLADLHDWLYGESSTLRYNPHAPTRGGGPRIRGVQLPLTSEQVLTIARQALAEEWGEPERYESWYVEVDGKRVAPKWLVSRLTGLPVHSFHSGDARRVLDQLGVEVSRL